MRRHSTVRCRLSGYATRPARPVVVALVLLAFAVAVRLPAAAGDEPRATRIALSGDKTKTTFSLTLSAGVTAEVFTLANPYRVIVDLPDVAFNLPSASGNASRGLVKAYRYGQFAEQKARVVIDTAGPTLIARAEMSALPDGSSVRLDIDLVHTDAATFGEGTGAAPEAAGRPAIYEDTPAKPGDKTRPVVMIDPGHGGVDPGTVGLNNILEKHVVLSVAKELQAALAATGRYDVRMTRSSDVFVSLDERLRRSRAASADLFISLHADSIDTKALANSVRGATIYTLSEKASDEQARLMAEKENASDRIAGLRVGDADELGDVRNILIDLMKRETANFSAAFSRTLATRLSKSIPMSRDPQRSASFKVLKQTGSPSVLIELGYMSNPDDEKLLTTATWQKQVAASITSAVEAYFSLRGTRSAQ